MSENGCFLSSEMSKMTWMNNYRKTLNFPNPAYLSDWFAYGEAGEDVSL